MGKEINLLESAPKSKKQVTPGSRTSEKKAIAREFDERYFTGACYNDYKYDGRWRKVVPKLQDLYDIGYQSSVLDIGCACGFLLYDLQDMIPGIRVTGFEVSEWARDNAMRGFKRYLNDRGIEGEVQKLEDAARRYVSSRIMLADKDNEPWRLPWQDNTFDLVVSINTIHNLPTEQCFKSLQEIVRVSKNKTDMFVQVDAYRNEEEKRALEEWNLTALTYMSTDEWLEFFKQAGYNGDYYWSILKFEDGKAVKAEG